MAHVNIKTKGMHCKSCETLINESLKELTGVNNVSSNHKTGFVDIYFDESKINMEQIKAAITKEGYGA